MGNKFNKGFTLIELLAVIIILGVILLIAVPTVNKYIEQSKKDTYLNNMQSFIDAVKKDVAAGNHEIAIGGYKVIQFKDITLERGSNTKSPYGTYDETRSYVVIRNIDGEYLYCVAAADDGNYGLQLTTEAALDGFNNFEKNKILFNAGGIKGYINRHCSAS